MRQKEEESAEGKSVREKVYGYYQAGYHCAEVVTKTMLDLFGHGPQREATRCASGFGRGIAGTTEELCGAFTGGVVGLGYLMKREEPGQGLQACGNLIKEFKKQFVEAFGSLNRSALLQGFEHQIIP